ncbi:MAG: transcriptional repressor [Candidatus Thorarchaeota archaeon]
MEEIAYNHPSLNKIYEIVKEKLISISFSTLYNTISTLERIELIKLINFKNETRIEMNSSNHIKIIKRKKGKIVDVTDKELINNIINKLKYDNKKHGYIMINVIYY